MPPAARLTLRAISLGLSRTGCTDLRAPVTEDRTLPANFEAA